jgi:xanthine dehydrogenase/oxidase
MPSQTQQGCVVFESRGWIDVHVVVQEINMYSEGDKTHYKQDVLEGHHMRQMYHRLRDSCEFYKRKQQVDSFNLANKWKKRGIALIPTKYGMSFTQKVCS